MADVSNPEITTAYDAVRDDNNPINWLLLDYVGTSDVLQVTESGSGGLTELKTRLEPAHASYGYIRITYANDKESTRSKFILLSFIGSQTKIMRKAKVSVHKADVKRVLRQYSLEVSASEVDDSELVEENIVSDLRKAGGASYDKA